MVDNTKRPKKNDMESNAWVLSLGECIDSLFVNTFSEKLDKALRTITDYDYSVTFAYHLDERPLCLHHDFSPTNRVLYVDDYLKGPYLLDPFFKACSRKVDPGLHRLRDIAPDRFYQSEYYRSYYVQTGLSEEISYILYPLDNVAVVISLMRTAKNSRFSAREFKLLQRVFPIVEGLSKHHWQSLSQRFEGATQNAQIGFRQTNIEDTVSALFNTKITPRETQVVSRVLEGHSSEAIAKSFGISVGTVRIHRRNVYGKLQISSQQELFDIFFQKIKTLRP
ncbi:MAG: DNA-binding CsgD family transcriptional regulator [Candidatus Azotimanducaceae bacterium]|jgi:DNA-binding CsgD family transcriptional regulator